MDYRRRDSLSCYGCSIYLLFYDNMILYDNCNRNPFPRDNAGLRPREREREIERGRRIPSQPVTKARID